MSRGEEWIWRRRGPGPAAARTLLWPVEATYRAAVGLRNAMYDLGTLPVHASPIPVVSVGNLTVGGTGKTPIAAWIAGRLLERGRHPAIVMRGYGDDEPRVHGVINPAIPVFVDRDRVRALHQAAGTGRDVAVLDDGFQHRRAARAADVVLISADAWTGTQRMLPAGPWREPLSSLARGTFLVVTRKAVSIDAARFLLDRLGPRTTTAQGCIAHLTPGVLVDFVGGQERALADLTGRSVLLAAGVGDPGAMASQITAVGARVTVRDFPDHHVYDPSDVETLLLEGSRHDVLACTLKDAVKLGPLWPRGAGPLWYVSQRVEFEVGSDGMEALLDHVLGA